MSTVDAPAFQATIASGSGASAQVITPNHVRRSCLHRFLGCRRGSAVALVVALDAGRTLTSILDAIGAAPCAVTSRPGRAWSLALNAIPTAVLSGLVVRCPRRRHIRPIRYLPDSHAGARSCRGSSRHADQHAPAVCARRHLMLTPRRRAYPPYQLGSAMTAPRDGCSPARCPGLVLPARVDAQRPPAQVTLSGTAAVRAGHVRVQRRPRQEYTSCAWATGASAHRGL